MIVSEFCVFLLLEIRLDSYENRLGFIRWIDWAE